MFKTTWQVVIDYEAPTSLWFGGHYIYCNKASQKLHVYNEYIHLPMPQTATMGGKKDLKI